MIVTYDDVAMEWEPGDGGIGLDFQYDQTEEGWVGTVIQAREPRHRDRIVWTSRAFATGLEAHDAARAKLHSIYAAMNDRLRSRP